MIKLPIHAGCLDAVMLACTCHRAATINDGGHSQSASQVPTYNTRDRQPCHLCDRAGSIRACLQAAERDVVATGEHRHGGSAWGPMQAARSANLNSPHSRAKRPVHTPAAHGLDVINNRAGSDGGILKHYTHSQRSRRTTQAKTP